MIINTPHGAFTTIRKDTIAISVIRIRRHVRHHRILWDEGDITFVEHRRVPTNVHDAKLGFASWATYVATFDLNGNEIKLACCKLNI